MRLGDMRELNLLTAQTRRRLASPNQLASAQVCPPPVPVARGSSDVTIPQVLPAHRLHRSPEEVVTSPFHRSLPPTACTGRQRKK